MQAAARAENAGFCPWWPWPLTFELSLQTCPSEGPDTSSVRIWRKAVQRFPRYFMPKQKAQTGGGHSAKNRTCRSSLRAVKQDYIIRSCHNPSPWRPPWGKWIKFIIDNTNVTFRRNKRSGWCSQSSCACYMSRSRRHSNWTGCRCSWQRRCRHSNRCRCWNHIEGSVHKGSISRNPNFSGNEFLCSASFTS